MRIRSMSAGRSGASVYNANVNGNQGGGDAKQGLAPTTNKRVQFVLRAIQRRAYATPEQRSKVFCINQLGGIGRPSKMFATTADGVNKAGCLKNSFHGVLNDIYKLVLLRNIDGSGLKTYSAILSGKVPGQYVDPVNELISEGMPAIEARIYLVVVMVYQSPEGQKVNGGDDLVAGRDAINKFFLKHLPISLKKGIFELD